MSGLKTIVRHVPIQLTDRSCAKRLPLSPPLPASSKVSESSTKAFQIQSAPVSGTKLCPLCNSAATGKADGKFKGGGFFTGFQAFPNRCCYECEAVWNPGCPKWAAIVCMVCGCAASALAYLMFTGFGKLWFAVIFGAAPILYGLDVLLNKGEKMKILSIGNFDFRTLDRTLSK